MEPKNRQLIAIAVIVLIVVAFLTSFGRSLFVLNTPSVILPGPGGGDSAGSGSAGSQPPANLFQVVEITPETVQDVIANTLSRSTSYYRELTVETFWSGGSSSAFVQTWVNDGWCHSRQALPSGAVRHDLVGPDTQYFWYEGSSQWQSVPADSLSSDLSQRLPTYETVLALDPDSITDAGYELYDEQPCVYVETQSENRLERFWIDIDSGLLTAAESESDGVLTYRMTAYPPQPCPADATFEPPVS